VQHLPDGGPEKAFIWCTDIC